MLVSSAIISDLGSFTRLTEAGGSRLRYYCLIKENAHAAMALGAYS
jgi:hypothetical protein